MKRIRWKDFSLVSKIVIEVGLIAGLLITLACIGLLIAAEWWRRRRLTSPPLDESPEELWDLH